MMAVQIFMQQRRNANHRGFGSGSPQVWTLRSLAVNIPRPRADSIELDLREIPSIDEELRIWLTDEMAFRAYYTK